MRAEAPRRGSACRDRSEEPVLLIPGTGEEVQGGRRVPAAAPLPNAIAQGRRSRSVCRRPVVAVPCRPTCSVLRVGADAAVPEVPDEQVAGEVAERWARAPGPTPRSTARSSAAVHNAARAASGVNSSTYPCPGPRHRPSAASCFAYVTKMFPPRAWIPNGAKPLGTFGSWNAPGSHQVERCVEDVDASIVEVRGVEPVTRGREPLVDRPDARAVAAVTAAAALTVGDQPTTVPASVAKRKRAGPRRAVG